MAVLVDDGGSRQHKFALELTILTSQIHASRQGWVYEPHNEPCSLFSVSHPAISYNLSLTAHSPMLTNMNNKEPDVLEVKTLEYLITHIFCPLKLPDGDDHSLDNDGALSRVTLSATCDFSQRISGSASARWQYIVKMLQNLDRVMSSNALDEALVDYQIQAMEVGGMDCVAFIISSHTHYTQMSWCI